MSLIEVRQLSRHTRLGLWRMDEPFAGKPREREREAVKRLLNVMMDDGLDYFVGHQESGKPFVSVMTEEGPQALHDWRISVSHTHGYAAILLSDEEQVGLDIERRTDRVAGIASRFIRPDEQADSIERQLLIWSAKEAVYKLFSEENLHFFDMRVKSVDGATLLVENLKRQAATAGQGPAEKAAEAAEVGAAIVEVGYEFTDDYVLTYTILAHQDRQPCTIACG